MFAKRIILYLPVLLLTVFALTAPAASFDDALPVTQDPLAQDDCWMATAPDDTIYAVWGEDSMKLISLYLIVSRDHGATWSKPALILGPDSIYDFHILADAAGLHLTFRQYDSLGDTRLFHTRSQDGGATWSKPQAMGNWKNVWQSRLFGGDGKLVIHLQDGSMGHLMFVSNDGGVNWTEKVLPFGQDFFGPRFLPRQGEIHLVFGGFKMLPIAYSVTSDDGDNWTPAVNVSSGAGPHSQLPTLAVTDTAIHVAWEDDRAGDFNVMYSQSLDNGVTWSTDVQMNQTYYGARTKLLADHEGVHLAWCQYHGVGWPGNWGSNDFGILRYRFSGDDGATWTDELNLSQNDGIAPLDYPDLGANNVELMTHSGGIAAWWLDKRDGNVDLYQRTGWNLFTTDTNLISALKGGTANLTLDAAPGNAGRSYIILGSVTGSDPGTPLPGGQAVLPINWDLFTHLTVVLAGSPVMPGFLGVLDAEGRGTAQLLVGALPPSAVGIVMHFAYGLNRPWDFASNAVRIEIGL